ncbi:MAG: 3-oxoacid CoA-transferase [Dehalococcoidia bacterium]|nr:3-oxoacid CoA-transferase [Dehalococcoidia bacterium]
MGDVLSQTKDVDPHLLDPFQLNADEGQDKVVSVKEAIANNVRPGMAIHFSKEAGGLIRELSRQFWGTHPDFTFIAYIVVNHSLVPIYGRLAKKLIASNCTHIYPSPGPIKIIQQLYKQKEIQIENWSLCSLQQRLMAGAMGVGFMPTRSIIGSSMAKENQGSFMEIDDPFNTNGKVGILSALQPDVSFIHGWAADRNGNTILLGPYDESLWGPRASRNGVIVTVEKLVSTEFIRQHSHLVKIPGSMVKSVSVAPFGAHPWGLGNHGLPEIDAYKEDYDFMNTMRRASDSPVSFDAFVKEWVLEPSSHEDYLHKLGEQRLNHLQELGKPRAWEEEIKKATISLDETFTTSEMMVVAAARQIQAKVRLHGYQAILAGAGASALAAWLAYYLFKAHGEGVELMMGAGLAGYAPRPGEPVITSTVHFPAARMLTDSTDMYSVIVGGANNRCISSLGAAQIDKYGNINTTRVGNFYLMGSGGGNDAGASQETIAIVRQLKERFVDKVDYITTPGQRVKTLVSQLGIFEKLDNNEFTLTAVLPGRPLVSIAERIEIVKKNCGWNLRVADNVQGISPPMAKELELLRLLDSDRFFIAD